MKKVNVGGSNWKRGIYRMGSTYKAQMGGGSSIEFFCRERDSALDIFENKVLSPGQSRK